MLPVNAHNASSREFLVLLLHLVDKLVSRHGELLLDDIAHGHEILKTFLEYSVHTNAIFARLSEPF